MKNILFCNLMILISLMKKIMYYLLIFFISMTLMSFNYGIAFKAKNRDKYCFPPSNGLTSGIKKSNNFGKNYDVCKLFSCNTGYVANFLTGNCDVDNLPNIACGPVNDYSGCSTISNYGLVNTLSGATNKNFTFSIKLRCNLLAIASQGYVLATTGYSSLNSTYPIYQKSGSRLWHTSFGSNAEYTVFPSYGCIVVL